RRASETLRPGLLGLVLHSLRRASACCRVASPAAAAVLARFLANSRWTSSIFSAKSKTWSMPCLGSPAAVVSPGEEKALCRLSPRPGPPPHGRGAGPDGFGVMLLN